MIKALLKQGAWGVMAVLGLVLILLGLVLNGIDITSS